ncbi:MAG: hypothetical protein IAG13_31855 [Deltaproteobacteria bacterium]|nr:hypothetical protein [Nannocystaceae bacterium]
MKTLGWMFGCLSLIGCVLDSEPVGVESDTEAASSGTSEGSASASSTQGTATEESGGIETSGGDVLPPECSGDFAASWDAWSNLQMMQEGRAYVYTRVETVETGGQACEPEPDYICDLRTTITVTGGMVTSRELVATPRDDAPAETCPDAYSESGDSIGSHDGGAPPLTLDALYQGCCDVAQMAGGFGEDFGQAEFEVDEMGVLSRCSDLLCDDCGCFSGTDYSIEDLAFAM